MSTQSVIPHGRLCYNSKICLAKAEETLVVKVEDDGSTTATSEKKPGCAVSSMMAKLVGDKSKAGCSKSRAKEAGSQVQLTAMPTMTYRVGEKIEYDAATGRVTNNRAANRHLARPYRKGWKL